MDLREAVELGVAGGAIVSLYPPWQSLQRAHQARRDALDAGDLRPSFGKYLDIAGDCWLFLARCVFGGIGGAVFHSQLTGVATYGALAVGASAPVLLTQLGRFKSVAQAIVGGQPTSADEAPTMPPLAASEPGVAK